MSALIHATMGIKEHEAAYSIPSDAQSNAGFNSFECTKNSDCSCDHCLECFRQEHIGSPVMPYREGDAAQMGQNVFAFMMQARCRHRFPLLELPAEVRFLILQGLLYYPEPLDFGHCYGRCDGCDCGRSANRVHLQILATCRQLHLEGSAILLHQNMFTLELYSDDLYIDKLLWMGFTISPCINPWMEHSMLFELISKLEVDIYFNDEGRQLSGVQAAAGHRFLVYHLVNKTLSRTKQLSSVKIYCSLDLNDNDVPFDSYHIQGHIAESTDDHEPSTLEQFILEPLANLMGAMDDFSLKGVTMECKGFLQKRMESLERFRRDQQLRIDMMSL